MSEKTTTDRLVRYAEEMGCKSHPNCAAWFTDQRARLRLMPGNTEAVDGIAFNPLTNPADAIELAEKLDIPFERFPGGGYAAGEIDVTSATLCEAICAAVDAALEKTT